jgi:hypothetical protein
MTHTMIRTHAISDSGFDGWTCPTCGRVIWLVRGKLVVPIRGIYQAVHKSELTGVNESEPK